MDRAQYERELRRAKQHGAQRRREKCADAVNRVYGCVDELQERVEKVSADPERHTKKHWVKTCQRLDTLLAERDVEARKDQIREFSCMNGLYVQSSRNRFKHIKQLVQEPPLARMFMSKSWASVPEVMVKLIVPSSARATLGKMLEIVIFMWFVDLSRGQHHRYFEKVKYV